MIIGFAGRMRAGKDTAAAYLIKEHGFQRMGFADKLKESVAALFGITREDVDKLKMNNNATVTLDFGVTPPPAMDTDLARGMTFCSFLQRYGTESHRRVLGSDIWVDQVLPVDGFYAGRKIVISDVRFQNEVDRINELGGIVCRIKRGLNDPEVRHQSEETNRLVGISYEIWNEGTIPEFHREIENMLHFVTNPMMGGL